MQQPVRGHVADRAWPDVGVRDAVEVAVDIQAPVDLHVQRLGCGQAGVVVACRVRSSRSPSLVSGPSGSAGADRARCRPCRTPRSARSRRRTRRCRCARRATLRVCGVEVLNSGWKAYGWIVHLVAFGWNSTLPNPLALLAVIEPVRRVVWSRIVTLSPFAVSNRCTVSWSPEFISRSLLVRDEVLRGSRVRRRRRHAVLGEEAKFTGSGPTVFRHAVLLNGGRCSRSPGTCRCSCAAHHCLAVQPMPLATAPSPAGRTASPRRPGPGRGRSSASSRVLARVDVGVAVRLAGDGRWPVSAARPGWVIRWGHTHHAEPECRVQLEAVSSAAAVFFGRVGGSLGASSGRSRCSRARPVRVEQRGGLVVADVALDARAVLDGGLVARQLVPTWSRLGAGDAVVAAEVLEPRDT